METVTTTYENLTPSEAAFLGGVLGGSLLATIFVCLIVWYVITIIATWRIFKKAGQPGWKAIIPIYNYYIMYKIVGMKGWFWASIIVSIVSWIIYTTQGFDPLATDNFVLQESLKTRPLVPITIGFVGIFSLIVAILNAVRTSRAFNHGIPFAVGLFFLQPIFWLILGFGSSEYNKKKALS